MNKPYTPGPWVNDGYYNGSHYIYADKGQAILEIASAKRPIHDSHLFTKAQAAANARLIAAAPDLLEALQELTDLMEGVLDGSYEPDSFTLQPAYRAIRNAIGDRGGILSTQEKDTAESPGPSGIAQIKA